MVVRRVMANQLGPGLAPKNQTQKNPDMKKKHLKCFFLWFFVVNHQINYLNLTLHINALLPYESWIIISLTVYIVQKQGKYTEKIK